MRLFVALDLPAALRHDLDRLGAGLHGADWVPAENLHLTLRFIGEVARDMAEAADAALATLRAPGFTLAIAGTGHFARGGQVRSLWAGVDRSPALDHLQHKVDTALVRVGLPPERRRFQPHVTLAGLDDVAAPDLARWMAANNLYRAAPVPIRHFTLFSSQRSGDGPVYLPEMEYDLAAPTPLPT